MGLAGHSVFNNYLELYNAVLALGVTGVKTTGTLLFDTPVNIHGTATTPITTNLAIDTTNIIEGAVVEVIWSGPVNPNITGVPEADIVNFGPNITTAGLYSIYITYTGGKFKVNIQQPTTYVGDGDGLSDPDTPTPPAGDTENAPTNLVLLLEDAPSGTVENAPTNLVLLEEETAVVENEPTNLVLTEEEI